MSDSVLASFQKPETPWRSISSDKLQDISDTSTNVSLEAESEDCGATCGSPSSQSLPSDEGYIEAPIVQPTLPYDNPESWWGASRPRDAMSTAYDQVPMGFNSYSFVPMSWADVSPETTECNGADPEWRTSVMIRNMPNAYTREMLRELIDSMGLAGSYDFVYLPIDFKSQIGLGYSLINFTSVLGAQLCCDRLEGYGNWKVPCDTCCTVVWSSPTQGLEALLDRYRNSPVMHHSLPDEWKPVLLQQGMRVAFPPPSKPIKSPKVRKQNKN